MSFVELERVTTPFDFLLEMRDSAQGLTGLLSYSTDLFDDTTIIRFLKHFRVLLEQIVADPEQRLSSLRLISEEETGGLTPSDFSDAELSQKDFENLLMALSDMSNV
jgi:non-ribosomal peptide synthetase component F